MNTLIEKEIAATQARLDGVTMTDSQRLVTTAALRNGFMLVDAVARLLQAVTHAGAALFGWRRLAR